MLKDYKTLEIEAVYEILAETNFIEDAKDRFMTREFSLDYERKEITLSYNHKLKVINDLDERFYIVKIYNDKGFVASESFENRKLARNFLETRLKNSGFTYEMKEFANIHTIKGK